jgi:hypothetical protein
VSLRRSASVAAGVLVVALALVVVGRRERMSERKSNLDGIAAVRYLVGSRIDHPVSYRVPAGLWCLIYGATGRPFAALELCVDREGRLVEAVDRRGSVPRFYSVTSEPGVADERLPLSTVNRLLAAFNR